MTRRLPRSMLSPPMAAATTRCSPSSAAPARRKRPVMHEGAVAAYDSIAARGEIPPLVADLARLRAAMILVGSQSPEELSSRIGDLVETGNPWRFAGARNSWPGRLSRQRPQGRARLFRRDRQRSGILARGSAAGATHARPDPIAPGTRPLSPSRAKARARPAGPATDGEPTMSGPSAQGCHHRTAQCRQVDIVQPSGRPQAGAGRRPARRHPRPAGGRRDAGRSRLHRDRYRRSRRCGARDAWRTHVRADRARHRRRRRLSSSSSMRAPE